MQTDPSVSSTSSTSVASDASTADVAAPKAVTVSDVPETCEVCGKTLAKKSTLMNHMKRVHGQDGVVSNRRRSLSRHKTRSSARKNSERMR